MASASNAGSAGLYRLRAALDRLVAELGSDPPIGQRRSHRLVEAFLQALAGTPTGESKLVENGEFVWTHTGEGTAYADAWRIASPSLKQVLPKTYQQGPQKTYAAQLVAVCESIKQSLDDDDKVVESILAGEDKVASVLDEEGWKSLEALLEIAERLAAEAKRCQADGCRWLLEIRRQGRDCFEAAAEKTFAAPIKEAAEFLVAEVEREHLDVATADTVSGGGEDGTGDGGEKVFTVKMKVAEAADYIRISAKTLRTWIKNFKIYAKDVGDYHFEFRQNELDTHKKAKEQAKSRRAK